MHQSYVHSNQPKTSHEESLEPTIKLQNPPVRLRDQGTSPLTTAVSTPSHTPSANRKSSILRGSQSAENKKEDTYVQMKENAKSSKEISISFLKYKRII